MANFNVMEYLKEKARQQKMLDDELLTSEEDLIMEEIDRHEMESAVYNMLGGAY